MQDGDLNKERKGRAGKISLSFTINGETSLKHFDSKEEAELFVRCVWDLPALTSCVFLQFENSRSEWHNWWKGLIEEYRRK